MARVTIEDCMDVVENRFALAVVAMKRARQIVMKKASILEREKMLAEAATAEMEESGEVPSAEVVEKNLDKSSVVQEEHKPILTALKEIAEKKVGFSPPGRKD